MKNHRFCIKSVVFGIFESNSKTAKMDLAHIWRTTSKKISGYREG